MRIEFQPAYVLHTRPYRDTSLLLDLLTPDFGRIGAVAKGVRRGKSQRRPLLNPFIPILVSLGGRSSLKTLTAVEADGIGHRLAGLSLYSGFYVNELIVRLLGEQDPNPDLFDDYRWTMNALSTNPADASPEPVLRQFEWRLLDGLGYGISFTEEADTGEPVRADALYRFDPEAGFIPTYSSRDPQETPKLFVGSDLLACAQADFSEPQTLMTAKRLSRLMLHPLLGSKPLKSRDLFRPA
ncbi:MULTISPECIES: DNA repair protein RecO [unclassified Marinimicrobium]|jgi:DNA repair protein RecO (recombination protein O)|uniref:DNA repair protein RecO n=1 Tax=unclassified Marinimicrobium TaxID=2632100 RepID=UPI0025810B4E|nr:MULTISPECIES: DNA repair protein RecO [unclassified Marinimicrobium]|tara:strand:- start:931 stop:1650 length:720 start_codon:yes stop_codon:yes gene_type:complete